MLHQIAIRIADYDIHLNSKCELTLDEGYNLFIVPFAHTPHLEVQCIEMPVKAPFECLNPLFEAANHTQNFYSIYQVDHQLGFVIYNQEHNQIQQYALLSADMRTWTIWSYPTQANTLEPLCYPMGPILMHYLALKYDALMIHASCVSENGLGRLFSGFSGVGKSTISRIWAENGSSLINDDRLIIRKDDDGQYWAHNTPMYYVDRPRKTVLSAIYLISHSPQNIIKPLIGAKAVSRVMAFCIQNNYKQEFVQQHLRLVSLLCAHIPVCELGFVPDTNVVTFIKDHESNVR